MFRLAIVDDHTLFREGLRALLAREADLMVVGEAQDAQSAYAMIEATRPDVVTVDMVLPGPNGVSVLRELVRRETTARLLALSAHAEDDLVAQALHAGAHGYSLKSQPIVEVVEAIRAVGRGERYLCAGLTPMVARAAPRAEAFGPCAALSAREHEVFDLLVRGSNNEAVAAHLCITVKTVETHRAHILKKLGVHSLVDLVRFAARNHLLRD
jgi:DNA-binding NarL/FixJ family response regulator